MSDVTLPQMRQIMDLLTQKKVSLERLQKLFEAGLLADILDTNPETVNRREFQRFLDLPPLVVRCSGIEIVIPKIFSDFVYGNCHYSNSALSIPKGLVLPRREKTSGKTNFLLTQWSVEDFLSPDDEEIDRNITVPEVLREMSKRGYELGTLLDLVSLLVSYPAMKQGKDALCTLQKLMIGDEEKLCNIVWQAEHLSIWTKLDANYGSNCRFLARRLY